MPGPQIEQWTIRVTNPDLMAGVPPDHPLAEWLDHEKHGGPPLKVPRIGEFFLQGMMNRMGVSYHKYGSFLETFPEHRSGVENAQARLDRYHETGNLEDLIDAANYLLIEFCRPTFDDAKFVSEDSDSSPGAVNRDGTISHGKVGE